MRANGARLREVLPKRDLGYAPASPMRRLLTWRRWGRAWMLVPTSTAPSQLLLFGLRLLSWEHYRLFAGTFLLTKACPLMRPWRPSSMTFLSVWTTLVGKCSSRKRALWKKLASELESSLRPSRPGVPDLSQRFSRQSCASWEFQMPPATAGAHSVMVCWTAIATTQQPVSLQLYPSP